MLEQASRVVCTCDNKERGLVRVVIEGRVKGMGSRLTVIVWMARNKPNGTSKRQDWPQVFRSQMTQYRDLQKVEVAPRKLCKQNELLDLNTIWCVLYSTQLNRKGTTTFTEVPFLDFSGQPRGFTPSRAQTTTSIWGSGWSSGARIAKSSSYQKVG